MPSSSAVEHAHVVRLADSLMLCLPASVVDALDLQEGDALQVRLCPEQGFQAHRIAANRGLERLRRFRGRLPAGFFGRTDGNRSHG